MERLDLVLTCADQDDGQPGDSDRQGIAWVRNIAGVSDAHPGAGEVLPLFELEEFLAGVGEAGKAARRLDRPADGSDHVVAQKFFSAADHDASFP